MNNVQLIMACVAFVSLLATILGGAWINQRGLERQMDAFRSEIKAELSSVKNELKSEIGGIKNEMESRFDSVDSRIDRIERQLDQIFKPSLPR
jgi:hypothetical protein